MTADEISRLMQETSGQISLALVRAIDFELIRAIEIIEGHVPADSEVAVHAHRLIFQDGRSAWQWRGETILELYPPSLGENLLSYHLRRFVEPDT